MPMMVVWPSSVWGSIESAAVRVRFDRMNLKLLNTLVLLVIGVTVGVIGSIGMRTDNPAIRWLCGLSVLALLAGCHFLQPPGQSLPPPAKSSERPLPQWPRRLMLAIAMAWAVLFIGRLVLGSYQQRPVPRVPYSESK
jgi:hypothetical protein